MTSNLYGALLRRRHSSLLAAIVILFLIRPLLGAEGIVGLVFSLALVIVLLAALLTIQMDDLAGERQALLKQGRRRRLVGWSLASLAVGERVLMFLVPSPPLLLLSSISWGLFFAYVTWSQFRSLLKQKDITGETISMAVAIYLLMGLCWGLLYDVILLRQPGAFHFSDAAGVSKSEMFAVLMYFSLTTLSTVGFGDITPVTLQARYAAVAEGIVGQLYLTILVARLVGMHLSRGEAPGR